ncbi:MAG: methylmalonyl Co-A mutase-associated GTPase MeaB [Spirosomataceae bacterium]
MKNRLSREEYITGIRAGNRVVLSRAITLIESTLPQDKALAYEVLEALLPQTGKSIRIGITGVPGVGKSTFIEAFGEYLTSLPKKIAVLAIDPSSPLSKGSILGDKTRMESLARNHLAYIRPTAAGSSLGGVAHKTRETMLLCEAAGFEVILVETVGVGQSEILVKGMVDFFLLLMLAGAGDELQGIKKGIMEMADVLAITKADGDNLTKAQRAQAEYQSALHLFPPSGTGWFPQVVTCSALTHEGIDTLWKLIEQHHALMLQNGHFIQNRQAQQLEWMHSYIRQTLEERFYQHPSVQQRLGQVSQQVQQGEILPIRAASELLRNFAL